MLILVLNFKDLDYLRPCDNNISTAACLYHPLGLERKLVFFSLKSILFDKL